MTTIVRPPEPSAVTPEPTIEPADDRPGAATGRRVFPWTWGDLGVLAGAFVVLVGVYTAVGFVVEGFDALVAAETDASEWIESQRTDTLTEWAKWGSFLSDTVPKFVAVLLLFSVFVAVWKRWHDSVFLAATMLFEVSVFGLVSEIVGRDRPPIEQLDGAPTNSFPSGHAAAAVAFYVGLALIVFWHTRNRWLRAIAVFVAIVAPISVAVSRFYLGMHYLSDLVAGMILGALSLLVVRYVVGRGVRRVPLPAPPHTRRLDVSAGVPSREQDAAEVAGTMRRATVVWNPASGTAPERDALRAALGDDAELVETTAEDPGTGQTERALESGSDVIVACGGDGTVRACLEPLTRHSGTLAILPHGTGNLLASNLGLPIGLEAASTLLEGHERTIDVGEINGETFAVMAGTGFDALMIRDADDDAKAKIGSAAYVMSASKHLSEPPVHTQVVVDGVQWFEGPTAMVLVGNFGTITGGLDVFPDAEPDDGLLDVAVLTAEDVKDWLAVLTKLVRGAPQDDQLVRRIQGSHIHITHAEPRPYELDGEARDATTELDIRVRPGVLRVLQGART